MDKKGLINYWLQSGKEDQDTMEHLLKGKRFVHALFFGHLYLEKLCKAVWVSNHKEDHPPRTHNLLKLLEEAGVKLDDENMVFLLKLNRYQIEGRYPEDIDKLHKITNEKLTVGYFANIKTIAECLLKELP